MNLVLAIISLSRSFITSFLDRGPDGRDLSGDDAGDDDLDEGDDDGDDLAGDEEADDDDDEERGTAGSFLLPGLRAPAAGWTRATPFLAALALAFCCGDFTPADFFCGVTGCCCGFLSLMFCSFCM